MYKCDCGKELKTEGYKDFHERSSKHQAWVGKTSQNGKPKMLLSQLHFCPCCGVDLQMLQTALSFKGLTNG